MWLDQRVQGNRPGEEGTCRPGWRLWPLLRVNWKPSKVWGIGEVWSDFYHNPSGCCVENRLGMRTRKWSGSSGR